MRKIPLNTFWNYFATEEGKIFRDGIKKKGPGVGGLREIKGHKNNRPPCDKWYQRYKLKMNNGEFKLFYGQRLMGFTYFGLKENDSRIMRHLTPDTFNNSIAGLAIGTHEQNQTIDRIESGNYFKRGVQSQPCPF